MVQKATDFEEYALYKKDTPVVGNISDVEIVVMTLGDAEGQDSRDPEIGLDDEVVAFASKQVECSGGEEYLVQCLKQPLWKEASTSNERK